jgi:predicted phage-related endonuclease
MPDGTLAILECKTSNYNCQPKWYNEAVPINYELQVRHYMAVLNLNTGFIACLFGNNDSEFVYRRIDRDSDYESDIIEQEKYFWEEYVQKQAEPPYTESGNLVLDSIHRKYGHADISAPDIALDGSMADIIEKYLALREQKLDCDHKSKAIDDEMKKVYAPILDLMGQNCRAVCRAGSSEYIISYNPSYRESITKDGLEVLRVFNPDIYDKYVSKTESRRLSIKKKELNAS